MAYVATAQIGGGTYAVVGGHSGAQVIDVSNPLMPVPGAATRVAVEFVEIGGGTYAVAGGLTITNATDPQNHDFLIGVGDHNILRCVQTGLVDVHTWFPGARC